MSNDDNKTPFQQVFDETHDEMGKRGGLVRASFIHKNMVVVMYKEEREYVLVVRGFNKAMARLPDIMLTYDSEELAQAAYTHETNKIIEGKHC